MSCSGCEAVVQEGGKRTGRDPLTGKAMTLPPRKVMTFKCSYVLRTAINGEGD
ncbi:MAG: HU family DNA-binding protein [Syntrophobacteraceae bacterium]